MLSERSIQLDIMWNQNKDSSHKIHLNTNQKISEDLVSIQNKIKFKIFFELIVDAPLMQPRKDYEDYAKFINDTFSDKKTEMLN